MFLLEYSRKDFIFKIKKFNVAISHLLCLLAGLFIEHSTERKQSNNATRLQKSESFHYCIQLCLFSLPIQNYSHLNIILNNKYCCHCRVRNWKMLEMIETIQAKTINSNVCKFICTNLSQNIFVKIGICLNGLELHRLT